MSTKQINLAIIGIGGRGAYHVGIFCSIPGVKVTAICDLYQDRIDNGIKIVQEKQGHTPAGYLDYKELLKDKNVDAVMITTSWTTHLRIAADAIRAGKHAAAEVCGASSLDECWQLVHAVEQTGLKCMFMENCNYGRREMATLNMVKKGIFGEVIHCRGGYQHDLREEVTKGLDNRHYRYNNYRNRNGELYPTHELGPIAKILNINRGNRFVSLSSVASKTRGIDVYVKEKLPEAHPARTGEWTQGDVITTTLKCAHGETVILFHDTTLPHPYSRNFYVQGTKAIISEDKGKIYIEGESPWETWEDEEKYFEKYEHPLWKKYRAEGVKEGGHDGMDWLVDNAYIDSIMNDTPCPIDVYDMATWMAVTTLSEDSVALGGAPVAFPDFTNGRWLDGSMSQGKGVYALDRIDEEAFEEQYR